MVSGSPLLSTISTSDMRPPSPSLYPAGPSTFLLGLGLVVAQPFLVRLAFKGFAAEAARNWQSDFAHFVSSMCIQLAARPHAQSHLLLEFGSAVLSFLPGQAKAENHL